MTRGHFRFSVGAFDCLAVSDGALLWAAPDDPPPAAVLFANAPRTEVEAALESAEETLLWTHWTEQITCLLVDTGRQRVLVDAGAGQLDPDTGRLVENLAGAGVAPSDIDAVIVTHGHADHIGGLLDRDGSLVFPAARVLLSKAEWRFWMEGQAAQALPAETGAFLVDFAHRTLPALEPCLELIDGEREPIGGANDGQAGPIGGIRCLPTPGHTPGHLAVELSSRAQRLLIAGDLVLHPLHVEHPGWHSAVDADPALVAQTRRAVFENATDEACRMHAFHFPFPGLGRVTAADGGWSWSNVS